MIVPPAVFGHELAGDVVAIRQRCAQFALGQRVVAANSAPCEECYFCRRGQQNLCEDLLFNNGAYAEYIRIPGRIVERNTLRDSEHVSVSGRRAGRAACLRACADSRRPASFPATMSRSSGWGRSA